MTNIDTHDSSLMNNINNIMNSLTYNEPFDFLLPMHLRWEQRAYSIRSRPYQLHRHLSSLRGNRDSGQRSLPHNRSREPTREEFPEEISMKVPVMHSDHHYYSSRYFAEFWIQYDATHSHFVFCGIIRNSNCLMLRTKNAIYYAQDPSFNRKQNPYFDYI